MKKFQFNMEPVLRLRQYKERMAQMELAKAHSALVKSSKILDAAKVQERTAHLELDSALEKGVWETEFHLHAGYVKGLKRKIRKALEQKLKMTQLVAKAKEKVILASINKKTMDILKDKRFAEYQVETGKIEQKQSDELASLHRFSMELIES